MPTFKAPQYSKVNNPKTGKQEPCYTFSILFESNETTLSFIAEKMEDISLQTLQNCVLENVNWWNHFISQFLNATAIFFSKPYTIDNINKIAKHKLSGKDNSQFPSNVSLQPNTIEITAGKFTVNWEYVMQPMVIDIPDLDEETSDIHEGDGLPDCKDSELADELQELNIDQLPIDKNSTEEAMEVENPAKFYDKQRVKEARLKAKLALYKANRQAAKYYDKYGTNDITDSESGSESEWETSEEEEEDEEVQL
jgi:hypothetical protein